MCNDMNEQMLIEVTRDGLRVTILCIHIISACVLRGILIVTTEVHIIAGVSEQKDSRHRNGGNTCI